MFGVVLGGLYLSFLFNILVLRSFELHGIVI